MSYQVKIPSCAFGGVGSIEKVKEVNQKRKITEGGCVF